MTAGFINVLEIGLFIVGILFLLGSIDDLVLDLIHTIKGLKPRKVGPDEWTQWFGRSEKPIAIMIPAWREHSVLEAMVRTNLARLKYRNYRFFVGVYPNDEETLSIAKTLEAKYPNLLTVVVTDRPGPTSKAHCLNCILNVISESVRIARRSGEGWIPHYVAIHDAEDVIHPKALTAINAQPEDVDFIQVPIFSLPVPTKSWVAGTYLDEFAEIHLKEIPVRQALGMPVPSAGVGTFLSWRSMEAMGDRFGYWFDEGNLTEDYEISLRLARLGAKQMFLLIRDEKGEIVATREYFPDSLGRSIRQKTRWTTGISLQTWRKWSWMGVSIPRLRDLPTAYALWRDRKALWSNPVSINGWILAALTGLSFILGRDPSASMQSWKGIKALFVVNTGLFALRIFQRARFCGNVYGWAHGVLAVPRLVVSTLINASASILAVRNFSMVAIARDNKGPMKWDKTDHKFPELELEVEESTQQTSRKEITQ